MNNARKKVKRQKYITTNELELATEFQIKKNTRKRKFGSELDCLRKGHNVSSTSKLKNLYQFLDKKLLLRVGVNLKIQIPTFDDKHQLILSTYYELAKLIHGFIFTKNFLHMDAQVLAH